MRASHWGEIPERGSTWAIALLQLVLRLGGLAVIRVVLAPIAFYYVLTHRIAREASKDYLLRLNAYCDKRGSPCALRAGWKGIYRHMYSFALSMAEKHAAWSGEYSGGNSPRIENPEVSRQLMYSPTGAVLLVSHLGNFDIAIAVGAFDTDRRFRVLMDYAGTRRFNRERLTAMQHERIVFYDTGDVGPGTAIELRQAASKGDVIVIAADRMGASREAWVEVRLLGDETRLPIGPWVIAYLLDCPVYAVFACRDGRGYRLIPYKICDRVDLSDRTRRRDTLRIHAQKFADVMQELILRYPEQWYNFYEYWHPDNR